MDSGEMIHKTKDPLLLNENQMFWEQEKANFDESRLVINKLKDLETYDLHEM